MQENQNDLEETQEAIPEVLPVESAAAKSAAEEHDSGATNEATAPSTPNVPAQKVDPEPLQKPKKEKRVADTSVMKVSSYMGALLLLMIPVVNLIMIFQWAFTRNINRNKRNLGIAALLLLILFIALFVGACILSASQFGFDLAGFLWSQITGGAAV